MILANNRRTVARLVRTLPQPVQRAASCRASRPTRRSRPSSRPRSRAPSPTASSSRPGRRSDTSTRDRASGIRADGSCRHRPTPRSPACPRPRRSSERRPTALRGSVTPPASLRGLHRTRPEQGPARCRRPIGNRSRDGQRAHHVGVDVAMEPVGTGCRGRGELRRLPGIDREVESPGGRVGRNGVLGGGQVLDRHLRAGLHRQGREGKPVRPAADRDRRAGGGTTRRRDAPGGRSRGLSRGRRGALGATPAGGEAQRERPDRDGRDKSLHTRCTKLAGSAY